MKTITFAVPCYNSAAYMDACIESLVAVGDDAAVRAMAANDNRQRRYSGLRWRLAKGAAGK